MKCSSLLIWSALCLLPSATVAADSVACAGQRGATVVGLWEGLLSLPGLELQFVIRLSSGDDGGFAGALLLPDQLEKEYAAEKVTIESDQLRLTVPAIRGSFEGRFNAERTKLEGRWMQGGRTHTVVLARVVKIRAARRPQTPKPPFPYEAIEVRYRNERAPAAFAGTLTLPRGDGPFPAVLLISGGGAQDRDGTILRHKPFLVLADHLTRNGIAALRVDDRGVGGSTGDRTQATSADYAEDALTGVAFLNRHPKITGGRIGLIGHSEGGTIAALAAVASPDVAFIIMLASPGLPGAEYHLQYEASTGRAVGQSEEAIVAKSTLQKRIFSLIEQEDDPAVAERRLRAMLSEANPGLPKVRIDAGVRRLLSPWFRFSLRHNPARTLQALRCPVLALFGEKDVQVPPQGNREAVSAALARAGNVASSVEVLPRLNHFFQTCETGSPTEYGRIDETIAPAALARVSEWVLQRAAGE